MSERQYIWDRPRICPQCNAPSWKPRNDKRGKILTHVNSRGERIHCPEYPAPECKCASCGAERKTWTEALPKGWVERKGVVFCTTCKRAGDDG